MFVYIANDSYQRDENSTILSMTAALQGRSQDTGDSLNSYVRLAKEDLGDGANFEQLTYTAKLEACKKKMASWLQASTANESTGMIVYIANDSYQCDESGAILSMNAALEGRNQDTGESLNSYVRLAKEDLDDGATFEKLTYTAKLEACKKKVVAWIQASTANKSTTNESTVNK